MCRWLILFCLTLTLGAAWADPMQPDRGRVPVEKPAPRPEPSLTLTSVYILAEQRFAVINGQWLAPGDTIHHYRIMKIRSDEAVLRRGERTRTLALQQPGELSITATDEE